MGRACSVCVHSEREAIDAALVGGEPNRRIAARYGLSEAAVRRHKREHIPQALVRASEAQAVAHGSDLMSELQNLQERTLRVLAAEEKSGNARTALAAIKEARANMELMARMITAAASLPEQDDEYTRMLRGMTDEEIAAEKARVDADIEEIVLELMTRADGCIGASIIGLKRAGYTVMKGGEEV